MKKILVITAALAMTFALAACSGGASSQSSASASSDASTSSAATSSASASASSESASASSATTGLANPWHDAATADAAAEGAGVGSFQVPAEGTTLECGQVFWHNFQYMEGLAEGDGDFGAAQFVIRKGLKSVEQEVGDGIADVSGDYTVYKFAWDADVSGKQVKCYGNVEGNAMKATWTDGDYSYSIMARGQGDDEETFGLSANDLATLVGAIA
ncbi:MAG: hypothetical protein IJ111_03805 [Eggerthellaceae bacterium]|nr:hypothetical protein [Eggerthellaceae bacterium]